METPLLLVLLAAALAAAMAGAWRIALVTGKSGWIDATWSFAVGIAGVVAVLAPLDRDAPPSPRAVMVALLAALWSVRLGSHIAFRTAKGGEDPRYAELRKEWAANFKARLFLFLQIQAAAALVLVVSLLAAAHNPAPWPAPGDLPGVVLVVVAIMGEGVADRQLTRFRADPANHGKVCDIGLWRYTRHPNYFFEWLGWLAYVPVAIAPDYPWGFAALLAPALMYPLLVHASGIPPLEAHMLRSRGDAFRAYQARTNAFWPGPPRNTT